MSKKLLVGTVVSTKMNKTVVVKVDRVIKHPLYEKRFIRSKKHYVHDADEIASVGDLVRIEESAPISKTKRWIVLEVITA